jgi:hypothetical protein
MSNVIEPYATISDYSSLLQALRRRVSDLGTSMNSVDHLAGLTPFHVGKLLTGMRGFGPVSFDAVLGALALRVVLVEDTGQLAKIRHRLAPRGSRGPRLGVLHKMHDRSQRARRGNSSAA